MHSGFVVEMQPAALAVVQSQGNVLVPAQSEGVVARALAAIEPSVKLRRFFDLYPSMVDIAVRLSDYFADVVRSTTDDRFSLFERCFRSALLELSKCRFYQNSVACEDIQVSAFLFGLLRHVDEVLDLEVAALQSGQSSLWPALDLPFAVWEASLGPSSSITIRKVPSALSLEARKAARYCIISKLLTKHDLVAIGGALCDFDRAPTVVPC